MTIETGELAKQANGSALVRYGDQNVVLCAATASEKPREGIDFFPLTCDFEEKMYAAGKNICNPTLPQYETGGMDLVVAGTADAVMMVEGGGNEISEDEFLGAIEFAHEQIKLIVAAIDELAKKCGKAKRQFPLLRVNA